MSTIEIKLINLNENFIEVLEIENSYGGAPIVWNNIGAKYLSNFNYLVNSKDLWPLWKNKNIPNYQRAVLAMTYDNALILKKDFLRAALDIEKYLQDFPIKADEVNHWEEIMNIFKKDYDCDAIGFYWTSVSTDPFETEWNENTEKYENINWKIFWSMYDSLI